MLDSTVGIAMRESFDQRWLCKIKWIRICRVCSNINIVRMSGTALIHEAN